MKYSGIGGQAVMEGVMMKNQEKYAVAVRKPDQEIVVEVSEYNGLIPNNKKVRNMPILRGVFSFIESLTLGMKALTFSASFFEEEEDEKPKKEKKKDVKAAALSDEKQDESCDKQELSEKEAKKKKKQEDAMMGGTMVFSVVLAVGIFIVLPYYISMFFQQFITSDVVIALLEGVIRLAIFVGYVGAISLMPDVKRVYMYHGAEHKCINCIEHGMELNVENVRKSSKQHKRCGTSFMLIVMLISIIFGMVIRVDNGLLKLLLRILLIPVIAGVSYEFIRVAGRSDHVIVNILSKPGMWLQNLTTKEPDDDMIEVGIASVEAVFDWRSYVAEMKNDEV